MRPIESQETQSAVVAHPPFFRASYGSWLRDVLILALGYFTAGYIGLKLAVPPGYATIIWPASGVALCGLLLRGKTIWPGVWLGSFAINLFNTLDGVPSPESALPAVGIAAAIGLGATIQALVGRHVICRFWPELELSEPAQVLRFLTTAVVLPCLVAPMIGVGALLVAGLVPPGALATNWLTWAVGDMLGVVFLVPILLFSSHSPVAVRWSRRALPGVSSAVAMCLAISLLLTFYAWQYVTEREFEASNAAFAALATDTEQSLADRIAIYERALDASAAFAANSQEITPAEWSDYVTQLDLPSNYPGMRGLGFFEAVGAEDMPEFRENFSREFGGRFDIHPDVHRSEHFVINRIEPLADNMAALGLNLAFEEGRRAAIALSRANGQTTMTRPIVLVQDATQGAGFLFMTPVGEGRNSQVTRWAYSPLVADEFLGSLTPREGEDYSLEVFFGAEPVEENLMFATATNPGEGARFEEVRQVVMANQPVTLRWRSLPPFEKRVSSQAPVLVLACGLVITVLLGLLLTAFTRREGTVLRKVEEATAELEEHNRMLELAEATAHVGHWQFDLLTEAIYWSAEVYRIHRRKSGRPPTIEEGLAYYHPDDREGVSAALEEAKESNSAFRFLARIIRDDGEMRHVEVIGQVRADPEETVTGIIGVIIDRTEEMLIRESLTKARDEAQAADKAKTNFLANMSHEIRTPMNGVIGFTELALSEEKDPAQRRRLHMIADSSNAMLRLLNDLLDFAKIEANQMVVSDEPTDLRHSLRGAVRLMEPVAKGKNITLALQIDPRLPTHILIDRMRLRQVVLNLVGNAIKFTEVGTVKVVLSLDEREDGAPARMTLAVRDTGIGIPAKQLASVFDKFTQADETTARRYGGTGLGLPISAQLVELMGGTISVESEVGEGSRFVVNLPLREADPSDMTPEAGASGTVGEADGDCGHPLVLRILVAEDNPVNQELTMAMVEKAGHVCDLARNGREATDMVIQARRNGSPYDLVLMDMQMPVLDGLGATTAIREAGISSDDLPIIAVTANAYTDDIRRCHEAGMQAHIAKPLRLGELCDVLARWSSRIPGPATCPVPELEQETDPRLNRMFAERVDEALKAIDRVVAREEMSEDEKTEIASLLHQIAGVAGYFGQAELGEKCREVEHRLLDSSASGQQFALLTEIRDEIDVRTGTQTG